MKYYKIFLCYSLVKLMEDLVQKGGGTLTEVQSLYCCKPYRFFFGDNLALFDTSHSTDSEPYASPGLSECERRKKSFGDPFEVYGWLHDFCEKNGKLEVNATS